MQITITIPDELAAQLQASGFDFDAYVAELVKANPPKAPKSPEQRRQAVEAMMQFAEKHRITTGGQDIKSMVHEGHKY